MRFPRFVLAAAGALALVALTAVGAVAGGVLFQSPGQYRFDEVGAGASFNTGTPYNPAFTDVTVERGTFVVHYTGSSPALVHQTVVQLTMFQPTAGNFGAACFVVPDSAFTVSSDLSTATLSATLTQDEETADLLPLVGGIGFMGKGGGSPCFAFGTLPLPITVNLSWTASGPLGTVDKHGAYSCAGFQDTFNSSRTETAGAVSGTVSGLDGTLSSPFGGLSEETVNQVVQGSGTIQPGCLVTSIV